MNRAQAGFVIFIMIVAGGAGSRAGPDSDKQVFAARRQALMGRIAGSVAILQGASATRAYTPFRQDNNFYYLTGVETPNAFLLVDAVRKRSTLFLPSLDHHLEEWEGQRLFPGSEARDAVGIEEVRKASELKEAVEKIREYSKQVFTPQSPEETAATSRDRASSYQTTQEQNPWDGRSSREQAFAANLKRILGDQAAVKDLSSILDEMRRVKDAAEIVRLREAAKIGAQGLKEAMRAAKPGRYEYQLAAVAEMVFRWRGAMGPAYFTIVGSGPNSCLIHYNANTRRTVAGDLVVMDAGPDYRYYAADITRTFPVSGKFTVEQAAVYKVVLEAQEAALAKVRPGAKFEEIFSAASKVLARHSYLKYLPHGVSHYVGMSTHDVGEAVPLEPGVVLTVEPGVYIPEKELGVRIEDTVLVTPGGCEILSREVPKKIQEIERLMAEKAIGLPD